jgi:hypothetical protein
MIDVLMRKGNAYRAADGSVYFRISSFPGYGALSRIRERELKVTNSVFDADHKDDVGDFALWKAYKPEEDGDVKVAGPEGAAAGPARLAHRVQRDDQEAPRGDDRPAHGRRRPALPAPRERDRPEPVLQRRHVRPPLVPQRAPARRTARR